MQNFYGYQPNEISDNEARYSDRNQKHRFNPNNPKDVDGSEEGDHELSKEIEYSIRINSDNGRRPITKINQPLHYKSLYGKHISFINN